MPAGSNADKETLLSPGQVARAFGVTTEAVAHWDSSGVLKAASRTPGGQRRFRAEDVMCLLANCVPESRAEDVMRLLASRVPESRRADVRTGDIIRLRDTEKLSWQTIGAKLGMSGEGVRQRYRKSVSCER